MRYEGALRSPIYDLCRQTVTVYHACYNPFRVTRCVIHGAYFERKTVQTVDKSGGKSCDEFLLVIPNKNARRAAPALFNGIPGVYVLECGDRIVEGVGEEITTREQWGSFVPANRPGVVTVDWVRDMGCRNVLYHVEACPLHGPVLTENLGYYIGLYDTWSAYKPESEGVFVAYASVYGNTKAAAELLAEKLREKGCPKVTVADLAREDMAECVEDAFRYDTLVLASCTYNGGVFPPMREFILDLTERGYRNRRVALIENGSWAATAAKVMEKMLEGSKDITFAENRVSIKSALDAASTAQVEALADELTK